MLLGPAVEELLRSTTLASAATADGMLHHDDGTLNASQGAEPYSTEAHSPGPDNAAQEMKVRG